MNAKCSHHSILALLDEAGNEGITISFAGSGDEGGYNRMYFNNEMAADASELLPKPLNDAFVDCFEQLIQTIPECRGYENNDGGQIDFTLIKKGDEGYSLSVDVAINFREECKAEPYPGSLTVAKELLLDAVKEKAEFKDYSGELSLSFYGEGDEGGLVEMEVEPKISGGVSEIKNVAYEMFEAVAGGYEDGNGGGGNIHIKFDHGHVSDLTFDLYFNDYSEDHCHAEELPESIAEVIASLDDENAKENGYLSQAISQIEALYEQPCFMEP